MMLFGPPQRLGAAGLFGAAIATTMAVLVSRLGVLRMILALTAGQAIGGLGLDLIAPARGETVTAGTVAGVVLACAAVLVTGWHARAGA
jgi:bacterial/archaeal transporter family-2 protein